MLGDPVPHRVHWPKMADLRVNAMQYRPYGRSANTKLGVNARDEPASVGVMCSQVRRRTPPAARRPAPCPRARVCVASALLPLNPPHRRPPPHTRTLLPGRI